MIHDVVFADPDIYTAGGSSLFVIYISVYPTLHDTNVRGGGSWDGSDNNGLWTERAAACLIHTENGSAFLFVLFVLHIHKTSRVSS